MGGLAPGLGLAATLALSLCLVPDQGTAAAPRVRRHLRVFGCTYAIAPSGRSHGAGADSGTVEVTTSPSCVWAAASHDSWLVVSGSSSGTGSGTVTYAVAANAGSARTGTLTIAGQTFTVTQEDGTLPNELTLTLPGGVPLLLVKIPLGAFAMGAPTQERDSNAWEKPQHLVTLTQSYYLGSTEVTQRQWVAVMGSNPSTLTSCGLDCPVDTVSWNDICGGTTGSSCTPSSFIGKLNEHLGTTKLRLPTEAEWERAARGGATTSTPFFFGDDTSCALAWTCTPCELFAQYMWWCGNVGDNTHPVGSKLPNQYGLYDMHGSVWEWVADWYDLYPGAPQTDPVGPPTGSGRVFRGGTWTGDAAHCRSAARSFFYPEAAGAIVGFRLARSL